MFYVPRFPLIAGVLTLVLLPIGCAKDTVRPIIRPIITDVRLTLSVAPGTGSPSNPVTADARATNAGNTRVFRCEGCGCGNGVEFTVWGPDGNVVLLSDPSGVRPMCPDGQVPIESGGVHRSGLVFTGTLYETGHPVPSPTYQAPAGRYTVTARFGYVTTMNGPWIQLERSATFDWQP